jgi:acetyl-CoA C-acetyltransferase
LKRKVDAMAQTDTIVIAGAARTPLGAFQSELASKPATSLGAIAIGAALEMAGLATADPQEVLMGCVLPAGLGQAPARQAAIAAGLPQSVGCTTVNKVCGSGMKAMMLAHDVILAGGASIVVAGGMESMSRAPYLLDRARAGYRLGHGTVIDHMFLDGLEDAYDKGRLMGTYAEDTATAYQFTREAQDAFAISSLTRAKAAIAGGTFAAEIAPVEIIARKGETKIVADDENPRRADPGAIAQLKPAFRDGGTVTAASSSSISDGAAALVLTRRSEAERRQLPVLALVRGHATHAQAPAWFTTAPIGAIRTLLDKVGWSIADVDLFEINEAFAVVTMAAMRDLGLPADTVNVHGGACALGHPIGASGARIVVSLLNALRKYDLRRGIAAICIGGGEATALAIERP